MARILAWRAWRVRWSAKKKGFVLRSVYIDFPWLDTNVESDQEPEKVVDTRHYGRLHGLHAVLAGSRCRGFLPERLDYDNFVSSSCFDNPASRLVILGAVEPFGRVVGHEDGVIRSEKMRILALRVEEFGILPECGHKCSYYILRENFPESQLSTAFYIPFNLCADGKCGLGRAFGHYDIFTKEEIERELLLFYEVPRLPEGVGPWKSPWGDGPEWMPPKEWLL